MREVLERDVRGGATVVLSSHVMELVEKICDRVGIIHEGGWSLQAQWRKSAGAEAWRMRSFTWWERTKQGGRSWNGSALRPTEAPTDSERPEGKAFPAREPDRGPGLRGEYRGDRIRPSR